ncbi:10724_t:CDS:2, partial [Funneliformis geosporum]
QPKSGHLRLLTGRYERKVLKLITTSECTNAVAIRKKLKTEEQIEVNKCTIKRTLHRNGMSARVKHEIKKIPEWSSDKYPGKNLSTNVYAYVKRRHKYIFNTNFLEKGEENNVKKTIREADELSEELGAFVAIDECEVNDQILSNLTKARNDPNIIDSTNLSEIIEQLKKIGKELSINSYMQPHIISL